MRKRSPDNVRPESQNFRQAVKLVEVLDRAKEAAERAMTPAERKAAERQRHKEAGRTAVTVHVRPEYVPEVRALEAKLQRRERKPRGPAP